MKKVLGILFLVLLVPAVAFAAPSRVGRTDIGLDISGAISTDSDLNTTVAVSGNSSYGVNEWLAIGVSFGWQNFGEDDVTTGGVTIPGPDITAYPLFADFIFRMPATADKACQPYAVLGLGAIFWDVQDVTASNGVNIESDIDTSLGVKIGGGADYFLNDNWILNVNANYVFSDADISATASAGGVSVSAVETLDLDYWTVGAGIKYLF